ncbi:hypothetical protein OXPF_24190 [Oxobacter pfennigii]|uniref:Methyltransferase type 11 domain-containing protein n=1 Tax=Oxobacter pfennigii TaxID=36849 RepID=A0A0P8W986_9CLOT|nr:methyltransferase domain-containing protein [Oxobacter pfennigii]KPU44251.1 hypothetical protein OXPF_24190 [Oxobacter pfennigii]
MHIGSYLKMEKFVAKYLSDYTDKEIKIIDIGSQDVNGSYKPLFDNPKWEYYGCDMEEGNNVDIVLKDVYNWKEVKSDSFDVVVSGQAFEHIEYFWATMLEISRVAKYGGLLCIIAPSAGVEHRYPVDCWRYYPDGFRALARYSGLEVLEVYTDWYPIDYPDRGEIWKDSVLICKKPDMPVVQKFKMYLKNRLSKLAVKMNI